MGPMTAPSDLDYREACGDLPEDPHAVEDYANRRQAEVVDCLRDYLREFSVSAAAHALFIAIRLEEATVRAQERER